MTKNLCSFFVLSLLIAGAAAVVLQADGARAEEQQRRWEDAPVGFASLNALGQNGTTGGRGGRIVTVRTQADLERNLGLPEPLVVRIEGQIRVQPFGKKMDVTSDKTILGAAADAAIVQGGFRLRNVKNVILRNLTIRDSEVPENPTGAKNDYDAVQVDDSHHIWIDHCRLTRMGDGLIDLRKTTDYVTVSWCELSDHDKAFGIGWTPDTDRLRVTIHHNRMKNTVQRNPSFDNGTGHLFNNWLEGVSSYGNYARGRAKLVVENSVFYGVANPLQCDPGAELVARGNVLKKVTGRNETKGAAFDPSKLYSYKLDDAARVPAILAQGVGPQADISE